MNGGKRRRRSPPLVTLSHDTVIVPAGDPSFKLSWWKKLLHAINVCPTTLGHSSKKVVTRETRAEEGSCHDVSRGYRDDGVRSSQDNDPIDCDIFYNFMLSETKMTSGISSRSSQQVNSSCYP